MTDQAQEEKTPVEEARSIAGDLEAKRVAALQTLAEIDDAMAALAFDAMTSGGEAAKRVKALDAEKVRISADVANLVLAIGEAGRRVEAAQAAADREDERRRKDAALPLIERQKELGLLIAAGLRAARDSLREFKENNGTLARLGAPVVGRELLETNITRALDAAMWGLHPKARPVEPGGRHELSELAASWMIGPEKWARDERAPPPPAPTAIEEAA